MNHNKYFSTQSLSLASALQALSPAKLKSVDFTQGSSKASFCFDKTQDPEFDSVVARFFSRELLIDAATYFDALRFVKSRLYEEQS